MTNLKIQFIDTKIGILEEHLEKLHSIRSDMSEAIGSTRELIVQLKTEKVTLVKESENELEIA